MNQTLHKVSLLRSFWFPVLAGALLLVIVGKVLWQDLNLTNTPPFPISHAKPDYFLASATSQTFNNFGQKAQQLSSHYLEHIRQTGVTKLVSPIFKIYQADNNQWQGKANAGFLYEVAPQSSIITSKKDELLWLQGAVQFRHHDHDKASINTNSYKLNTESLKILPQQNKVISQQLITFTNGTNLLSAESLMLDLNHHHLFFQNNFIGKILPRDQ